MNNSKAASKNESYNWAEFSSDESDANAGGPKKLGAARKKAEDNDARNKENKVPRKAPVKGKTESKIPRKVAPAKAKHTINEIGGQKFGRAAAAHKNKGKVRTKSPKGGPMVLSRRLSRRILKGSPLRSPITACALDFASAKKAKGSKKKDVKKVTDTKPGGRPPRAP